MKTFPKKALLYLSLLLVLGCSKELPEVEENNPTEINSVEAPELTRRINTFIKDAMVDVYLWYKEMPSINQNAEFDSKAYFKKLLVTEDKWSMVTDDIQALENSFQGIEKAYGYSLAFGRFSNQPENYFAVVQYVYPRTPASRAGFERGDIIIQLNSGNINAGNYRSLLSGEALTVTKGVLTANGITTGVTVSMAAEELNLNPVLMYKVIEQGSHRIGYLLYTQYIDRYNDSLNVAFQYFKDRNITDLVLDLRYNPGGSTSAAQHLCSSIAPEQVVNSDQALVTYQWNDKYQNYWTTQGRKDQMMVGFKSTVPIKLNLNRMQVLTSKGSASASELTITGLEPYMNLTLVGDTTYGKYTASITVKPTHMGYTPTQLAGMENWGIQPIVIRFANSQGVTNFKNGFAPNHQVRDELLPAQPLGSLTEPLLKKAVENITGTPPIAMKSAIAVPDYVIFDSGFSKFDEFKKNLPINDFIDVNDVFLRDLN